MTSINTSHIVCPLQSCTSFCESIDFIRQSTLPQISLCSVLVVVSPQSLISLVLISFVLRRHFNAFNINMHFGCGTSTEALSKLRSELRAQNSSLCAPCTLPLYGSFPDFLSIKCKMTHIVAIRLNWWRGRHRLKAIRGGEGATQINCIIAVDMMMQFHVASTTPTHTHRYAHAKALSASFSLSLSLRLSLDYKTIFN